MAHAKLIPGSSTISLTVYLQTTDPDWYPGANYYLYLPVPWWRLWQDHPFTVASFRYSPPGPQKVKVALEPISKDARKSEVDEKKHIDLEKQQLSPGTTTTTISSVVHKPRGAMYKLTFLVSTKTGLTKALYKRLLASRHHKLTLHNVLLSGPYSPCIPATTETVKTQLFVAGGIGISFPLAMLMRRPLISPHISRRVLMWSTRDIELVKYILRRYGEELEAVGVHLKIYITGVTAYDGEKKDGRREGGQYFFPEGKG